MSKYTTGEIAKLCGVTVRTVQYYDTRKILTPSELSDGGRRLYSEDDLRKMKIICFLRELNFPINSISELLSEERPENVISLLLEEQEKTLLEEMKENRQKLDKLNELRQGLKMVEHFSVESIGDIAHIMENKKKMRKLRTILLITGIPIAIIQWISIILWITSGIWWLFAVYALLAIPYGVWATKFYFKRVAYICPQCHEVFKPHLKESFFASHTPNTRKLTCPACGHHGFCVETYNENMQK